MGFVDWFQDYCLQQNLPPLRASERGGASLRKELLLGDGKESLAVVLLVDADAVGVRITLVSVVATLPFHPLRRAEFLRQRLRLNTPQETGGIGFLCVSGKEMRFVSVWRERVDAGLSASSARLRFEEFVARARRYRKIFAEQTRQQLRDAGETALLALERGSDDVAVRMLKL